MSLFYENEEFIHKEKAFQNENRRKHPRNIVRLRFNNGRDRSAGTVAMIMTVPANIVRQMGLQHGDLVKIELQQDNESALFRKIDIGETIK